MTKKRSNSAQSGRQLWLQQLNQQDQNILMATRSGSSKTNSSESPWKNGLRKNDSIGPGTVTSNASINQKSFTNLKNVNQRSREPGWGIKSSSEFLREEIGIGGGIGAAGAPPPMNAAGMRPPPAAAKPGGSKQTFKSVEEYHDETIDLKRQVSALRGENDVLKARFRRIQEEKQNKDKELDKMLSNGNAPGDLKTGGIGNQKLIMQNLRKRTFQLESQLKDKDNELIKLQSDLKYTKTNEFQIREETFLQEINCLRLQLSQVGRQAGLAASTDAASGAAGNALADSAASSDQKSMPPHEANVATGPPRKSPDRELDKKSEASTIRLLQEKLSSMEDELKSTKKLLQEKEMKESRDRELLLKRKNRKKQQQQSMKMTETQLAKIDWEKKIELSGGGVEERMDQLERREEELMQLVSHLKANEARVMQDLEHQKIQLSEERDKLRNLQDSEKIEKKRSKTVSMSPSRTQKENVVEFANESGGGGEPSVTGKSRKERESVASTSNQTTLYGSMPTEVLQSAMRGYLQRKERLAAKSSSPDRQNEVRSAERTDKRNTNINNSTSKTQSVELIQSAMKAYNHRSEMLRNSMRKQAKAEARRRETSAEGVRNGERDDQSKSRQQTASATSVKSRFVTAERESLALRNTSQNRLSLNDSEVDDDVEIDKLHNFDKNQTRQISRSEDKRAVASSPTLLSKRRGTRTTQYSGIAGPDQF